MSYLTQNKVKDFALLLLLFYAFSIHTFISLLLEHNIGTPPIPYMVEIFLAFPVGFMLARAFFSKRLKLPYLGPFLLVELLFIFFESELFRPGNIPDLSYPYSMLIFYSIFVALVNYGITECDLNKITSYSLFSVIFLVVIVYLGYLGILNISLQSTQFTLDQIAEGRPLGNIIHTNGLSLSCCIAIYLLIFCKIDRSAFEKNEKVFILLMGMFLIIIIINSSMGAFIITTVGAVAYLRYSWKLRHTLTNLVILYVLVFLFIALAFPSEIPFLNKFYLYNRTGEGQWTSRLRQVHVTWVNFMDNPWLGVGYYQAARDVISGYTRSNFHYTQILAANGIFYFGIYMFFLTKMFGLRAKDLKSFLCMSAGFGTLMFYNWSLIFPLAVIAYMVYCEKSSQEFEPQIEISTSGLEPFTPVTNSHSLMGLHYDKDSLF